MFAFHQLISTTHHTTLHLLDPFFNKTLSSPLSSSHNWEVSFWHLFLMFECYITCTWSSSCKLQYKLLYLWPSIFCSWGWVHPFRSLSIRDNVSEISHSVCAVGLENGILQESTIQTYLCSDFGKMLSTIGAKYQPCIAVMVAAWGCSHSWC
mgnify:FL=1